MDKVGTAVLLYRGMGQEYSSSNRLEHRFTTDSDPQVLSFGIDRELQKLDAVAFHFVSHHPDVPVAYIKIYSVDVYAVDPQSHNAVPLIEVREWAQLQAGFRITDLAFNDRLLGELYAVEEDPAIEYVIPDTTDVDPRSSLKFEIELEYLSGKDYILARDRFLARQELSASRIRALESRIAQLETKQAEFERLRNSPVWTKFKRVQRYYERLLQVRRQGVLNTGMKVFDPEWWSRRRHNEYERWRTTNGLQNRPDR